MNLIDFEKNFLEECEKNNIRIETEDIEWFYKYMGHILEWNTRINLTAIRNEEEFIVKHFIDSLTINKHIENGNKIIDIGTGAGLPGIPLKITNKESKVTLIDSVNKKLNVIKEFIEKTKLENIEVIHARAEDLLKKEEHRNKYDIAVTRAVSSLKVIIGYMLPFLKTSGKAICMKGPNFEIELEEAKPTIERFGGEIEIIEKIKIHDFERVIIIIKRTT